MLSVVIGIRVSMRGTSRPVSDSGPLLLLLPILGFHCHAIEKKNRNHSMNEVKKLT